MQISNNARSDVVWFCHFLNFQLECTAHSWPNVPLHVINTNNAIFFLLFPTTWGSSVLAATAKTRTDPEQLTQVMCFFPCRGRKVRLVGPPHITHLGPWPLSNALPIAGPARPPPITSGPKDPVRFLSPCSKCTSGSHLTPVRPNFHFRGRCGFQIIYHFPKCFHMCAAFPSAPGPCLRPTFSKCIKIQFAPKKFRHWCFIVVMSGNY